MSDIPCMTNLEFIDLFLEVVRHESRRSQSIPAESSLGLFSGDSNRLLVDRVYTGRGAAATSIYKHVPNWVYGYRRDIWKANDFTQYYAFMNAWHSLPLKKAALNEAFRLNVLRINNVSERTELPGQSGPIAEGIVGHEITV